MPDVLVRILQEFDANMIHSPIHVRNDQHHLGQTVSKKFYVVILVCDCIGHDYSGEIDIVSKPNLDETPTCRIMNPCRQYCAPLVVRADTKKF